jgi:hypothetical protein
MRAVSIALVHYPVLDGRGELVTTAVTNLDVHDLARTARTYGARDYFVVHPIAAQRELVARILEHWTVGSSGQRIPDRREALSVLRIVPSLEAAIAAMGGPGPGAGDTVEVWVTAARAAEGVMPFAEARQRLREAGRPVLLVFGTGWGLAPSVMDAAERRLAPIRAAEGDGYNHLSVRAACAIAMDRLLGDGAP